MAGSEYRELMTTLVTTVIETAANMPDHWRTYMQANGYVLDKWPGGHTVQDLPDLDPETRWQAMVFSMYTDMMELADQAHAVMEGLKELGVK